MQGRDSTFSALAREKSWLLSSNSFLCTGTIHSKEKKKAVILKVWAERLISNYQNVKLQHLLGEGRSWRGFIFIKLDPNHVNNFLLP